jgi:two-component system, cell cycle response regulator DivK
MKNGERIILIVEDNEINMKLIVAVLEMGQYGILKASDAETGLSLAREYHPDLILMDLQLPGMDGISAAALLKADKKLEQIPVIALTGSDSINFGQTPSTAGFSGLITKPFEVRSFLETVSGCLRGGPEATRFEKKWEA